MLNVIDEFTHECLAIRVARKLKAIDVIDVLSDLFILRGVPGHIRSDNGPEFIAKAVQEWISAVECALFGGQRHAAVLTRRWAC
jgi:putative transposase